MLLLIEIFKIIIDIPYLRHIYFRYLFTVEIREVKEVRIGKQSKDFEKWPEDAKRIENLRCFVVYYGSEFRLKTLSISGKYDIYKSITVFIINVNYFYIHKHVLFNTQNIYTYLSALSEKECELWIKGLRYLVQDTINAPYPLQVERWLRKEFYTMENSRET